MSQGRVFFINRFYWPEEPATAQLLTDLATFLAARGHRVSVVASRPPGQSSPYREVRDGVAIERVRSTRWGRHNLVGRAVDFATFYPAVFLRLLLLVRRGDILVALTDPPLIGVVVALLARFRGARVAHWVQDIYPEIAVEVTGHRWPLLSRPLRDRSWRNAVACVVPGADMARTIVSRGIARQRVHISPNWAPAGVAPPHEADVAALRRAWGLSDKFVLAYSGNLGRVHDLEPLLELAAELRPDPHFALVFIGHGARRKAIEHAARIRGLANIHFHPPQPREHLATSLGVGDVHAVTLLPGAEKQVFPSKLYGIAKVGRPVLFIGKGDSELAGLIRTNRLGAGFDRTQVRDAAAFLTALRDSPDELATLRQAARSFQPRGLEEAVNFWDRLIRAELAAPHANP